jgi:hypothetical protein
MNSPASEIHPRAIPGRFEIVIISPIECSGVKRHENPFATDSVVQNNVQASRKQNPEGCIRQAGLEQNLAKQNLPYLVRLAKPRDLRSGQQEEMPLPDPLGETRWKQSA